MRKMTVMSISILAAVLPGIAMASHFAPGEWEATSQMKFTQGGLKIPPEVKAMMEKRGMKAPGLEGPHTSKYCLTPEEAAKDDEMAFGGSQHCRSTKVTWSGNRFHSEFTCGAGQVIQHAVADGTVTSDGKGYTGTMHAEGDNPHLGGHFAMEGHASGKWLGAACAKNRD